MKNKPRGTMNTDVVAQWAEDFADFWERAGQTFPRRDSRARAEGYIRALLGRVERKNGWQMAEYLGLDTPDAIQFLLDRAVWNADKLRDELQRYARAHLLPEGEGGVLVVDETGFLKKGTKSVGVQRQYSGTAGRTENAQIGVFLALHTSRGRALIDRALYLPKSWCDDPERCRQAKVPEGTGFATKPRLAEAMLARAFENGFMPDWVLADEVYGGDPVFRGFLERRARPYVVAVSKQHRVPIAGRLRRVDVLAHEAHAADWHRLSVGDGSKGPRAYDWVAVAYDAPAPDGFGRWVLIRRSVEKPEDLAYYFCFGPLSTGLDGLAVAAGRRWSIECCFEAAKQETGLDEYEVRSWHGWHRHITFSMIALAFLSVVRWKVNAPTGEKKRRKSCSVDGA